MSELWNRRLAALQRGLSPAAQELARACGLVPDASVGLRAFAKGDARPRKPGAVQLVIRASRVRWKRQGLRVAYTTCWLVVSGMPVARVTLGDRRVRNKTMVVRFDHGSGVEARQSSVRSRSLLEEIQQSMCAPGL